MEEQNEKQFIPSHPSMVELAKGLSDITRKAGRYKFLITFTATEGNLKTLEEFQKYAFAKANNEYLIAINKLLEYSDIFNYMQNMENRISLLEAEVYSNAMRNKETKEEKVEDKGPKTF